MQIWPIHIGIENAARMVKLVRFSLIRLYGERDAGLESRTPHRHHLQPYFAHPLVTSSNLVFEFAS